MLKERNQTFKLSFIVLDLLNAGFSFTIALFTRYYLLDDGVFQVTIIDLKSYF